MSQENSQHDAPDANDAWNQELWRRLKKSNPDFDPQAQARKKEFSQNLHTQKPPESKPKEKPKTLEEQVDELKKQLQIAHATHENDVTRIERANSTIRSANKIIKSLESRLRVAEQRVRANGDGFDPDFAALGLDPKTAFIGLTERQTVVLVTGVRNVLAKIHHPDQGGNTAKMQRINAAADNLKHPSTRGNHKR